MATPPSAWTGEKPRKAGNGAGRGSAARSGEKVVPISPTGSAQDVHRTPPHSVEAEQGVLGSMLISPRETIAECVEKINEEYFYVPAHRTIYDVLVDLWNTRQGIDLITFTQVLRDRNLLDSVGGAAFVTNLFTFVPTAANVQYYLEIVRDKYILRQIISAATESVRRAYEEQEEVDSLLDEVEQKIFDVGEDRFKGQMLSMKDHAMQAIETIEKLYERKGSITGISTGFVEFDRMTSGLHPSEMVVIAARPSMGKTALAMNIAEYVAINEKLAVGVFSLEMSSQQLVQRMLCSRARVNLQRVRDGFLGERDFPSLTAAASKLAEARMFIDDSASLSILELRAKARRLKAQQDVSLIIVDYLQLLRSTSRRAQDNRQLEISEISAGLKALAKDLKIPVIVVAQLNRQPEQRTGGKPRLSDLRESGCLAGNTLITRADTGERIPIKTLAERKEQRPVKIWAVDSNLRMRVHDMVRVFASGRKLVYELRTRSGRKIKASGNHPFLRLQGWTQLAALRPGDHVAIPRQLHCICPSNPISDDEIVLLAHLLGDGCILPRQPYHYTSADSENLEAVRAAAERLFGIKGRLVRQKNWHHLYLPSPRRLTHSKIHPITAWFNHLGLERCRSYEKRIPNALFHCDDARISLFLRHLWATDGNISWRRLPGRKPAATIYYASSSAGLTGDAQYLLLRLGIFASSRRIVSRKGYRDMYHLHVEGAANQLEFLSRIGCVGSRGLIVPELIQALKRIRQNPNRDAIPAEAWKKVIEPTKRQLGLSWREVCQRLEMSYCGSALFKNGISRNRMLRLAAILPSPEVRRLATSDVYWDQIVAITELGEEDVYDATVDGAHNFIADGFLVHNSIEQDADLVGLLVRPELYEEDEEARVEKAGEAELIIAKQRNGPVGEIPLTFLKEYTRFETRARNVSEPEEAF